MDLLDRTNCSELRIIQAHKVKLKAKSSCTIQKKDFDENTVHHMHVSLPPYNDPPHVRQTYQQRLQP